MAIIEELIVRVLGDVKDINKKIDRTEKNIDSSTKKMRKDFKALEAQTKKSSSVMQTALGSMAGFVGGGIVLGAFARLRDTASGLFTLLLTDGVAGAQASEDAINALNTSLKNAGTFSRSSSEDLQEFAQTLEGNSIVAADQTIRMLALAQSFVTTADDAKELTAAALDFSVGAGLSFEESIRRLGRGVQGASGDIANFAPEIRNLTREQLKAGEATRILGERFKGAALSQIQTYSGAIAQLGNTWGAATEEIGKAIIENEQVIGIIKDVEQALKDSLPEIASWAKFIVEAFTDGQDPAIKMQDEIENVRFKIRELQGQIERSGGGLLGQFFRKSDTEKLLDQISTLELLETRFDNFITKRVQGRRKDKDSDDGAADGRIENIDKLKEAEIKFIEELSTLQLDSRTNALTAIDFQQSVEQTKLESFLTKKQITHAKFLTAQTGLEIKFDKQRAVANDVANKLEESKQFERFAATQASLGALSVLQRSKNKEFVAIGKTAAIAQALIATHSAANQAAAALAGIPIVGPGLAIAARAAFLISGFAQVQSIRGVGFRHGIDSVPGIGTNDSFPATLAARERVVQAPANKDLTDFLKVQKTNNFNGGGGETIVRVMLTLNENAHQIISAQIIEDNNLGISVGSVA